MYYCTIVKDYVVMLEILASVYISNYIFKVPHFLSFVQKLCLNPFPNKPWFLRVCSTFFFLKTVGKGENARDEQFLLFQQCFLPIWRAVCHFHQI